MHQINCMYIQRTVSADWTSVTDETDDGRYRHTTKNDVSIGEIACARAMSNKMFELASKK